LRRAGALLALLAFAAPGCGSSGSSGGETGSQVTFQRPPPTTAAQPGTLRPEQLPLFRIKAPAGWTRHDETLAGGLARAEWTDPHSPRTSVLVDAIANASSTVEERARRNRERGAAKPGYREHTFEPTPLAGRDAWLWDYELSGRRVADYFLNDCGDGYAIQGTAPVTDFPQVERTFRQVAESLHSAHC
jgi:hypothetical protein